jgi:hypothetical protein
MDVAVREHRGRYLSEAGGEVADVLIDHLHQVHAQLGVPNHLREVELPREHVRKPLGAVVEEDVDDGRGEDVPEE